MVTASIVSSVIAWDNIQVDGRSQVREVHTDNAGNQFTFDYMAAPGTDVNAVMEARIPAVLANSQAMQNPPADEEVSS